MAMKMNLKQNKIGKVMREFKKGELNIGQSSKKVKSPKQAIAIAISDGEASNNNNSKDKEDDKEIYRSINEADF